jgi:hypothetical protein
MGLNSFRVLTIEQITVHLFEETGLSWADFSAEQVAKFQLYIEYFLLIAKQIDWKQ